MPLGKSLMSQLMSESEYNISEYLLFNTDNLVILPSPELRPGSDWVALAGLHVRVEVIVSLQTDPLLQDVVGGLALLRLSALREDIFNFLVKIEERRDNEWVSLLLITCSCIRLLLFPVICYCCCKKLSQKESRSSRASEGLSSVTEGWFVIHLCILL